MSFAPFENIFRTRDVGAGAPTVNLFSSITGDYSALIISSAMQLGSREVMFAAVYGQFDEALIGGSANCLAANSFPDPTKQIVYYKGDDEGKAFFSKPDGPPNCDAFTHCIYVFDVQNNKVNIQGKTGVAYTVSLDDASKITMEDLPSVGQWCKTKTAVVSESSVRATDSTTTSNWILGIVLGIVVVLVLVYFFNQKSKPIQRKRNFASPLRALPNTPIAQRMRNREIMHTFD